MDTDEPLIILIALSPFIAAIITFFLKVGALGFLLAVGWSVAVFIAAKVILIVLAILILMILD